MSITLTALQKQRRDTAANWTAANPTLLAGEIGIESDTNKIKIGDGSTAWASLAYTPWSQLSAYPIVNADISSTAEIAVSKLADGTARQLLQTDAAGTGVEWTSNVDVPGTLDVTGAATFDSNVTIQGDLTVNGTTTTIDTTNLAIEDKNIEIGKVATPTDATADGGGITLKGTTDKTINWVDATDAWTFSEHVNIASGKEYRINGTKVLDATSLGSGVVSSSLTSVGTIGTGVWQGTAISDTYLATISTVGKVSNSATTATSANTASAIVARDASGNFSAGTITANLSGNASTVTTNANLTGDVTSVGNATSIAAGVIVNADVNASAAIAGTKISPDFGSQTVTTTGVISAALGAAGTPSLTFTGDLNTGIYSPGADQVAISTGGSGRLFVDSTGRVGVGIASPSYTLDVNGTGRFSNNSALYWNDSAGTARRTALLSNGNNFFFGDIDNVVTNSNLTLVANANAWFTVNGSERARIDSSGRLLVGTSSARGVGTSYSFPIENEGTGAAPAGISFVTNSNDAESSYLVLGKSRGTSIGANTIVQANDVIGRIAFAGADGTDLETRAAAIEAQIDGTPGANNMPGRIVLSTTASGASSPTERLRIANNGAWGLAGANYGSSGQVLTSNGSGSAPTWSSAGGAGTLKAWVNFNGTSTVAIRANGNVSSITDNGTGDYTVNFTTAISDANYSVVATNIGSVNVNQRSFAASSNNALATGSCRMVLVQDSGALNDQDTVSVAIFR